MIRRLELWHSFQIIKTYQFAFNFLLISAYHFHRLRRVSKMCTICMNCIKQKNIDCHIEITNKVGVKSHNTLPFSFKRFFSKLTNNNYNFVYICIFS